MTLPDDLSKFDALREIIAKLRAPDGCPWDRKQTHASLRESFLQECYEVLESLDEADARKLSEEACVCLRSQGQPSGALNLAIISRNASNLLKSSGKVKVISLFHSLSISP